jgi:hypothetical protein
MAFSLTGVLGIDGSRYEAGMRKMEALTNKAAKNMGDSFKHHLAGAFLGAVGVAAIEETIRRAAEYASNLKDLAEQNNLTTDEVQKLTGAASGAGLEFEALAKSINQVADARKAAASGDEKTINLFEKYGVTIQDILDPQKRANDLIDEMAKKMEGIKLTPQQREDLKSLGLKPKTIEAFRDAPNRPVDLSKDNIEQIDKDVKSFERAGTKGKAFVGRLLAGAGEIFGLFSDTNSQFKRQVAKQREADATKKDTTQGIAPEQDPRERKGSEALSALYEKGLDIQFGKMGNFSKERELQRRIATIENQMAEFSGADQNDVRKTGASTFESDAQAKVKLQRDLDAAKLELQNFKFGLTASQSTEAINERQKEGLGVVSFPADKLVNVANVQANLLKDIKQILATRNTTQQPGGQLGILAP